MAVKFPDDKWINYDELPQSGRPNNETKSDLDKYSNISKAIPDIRLASLFDTLKYIARLPNKRMPHYEKESVAVHIYEMMYLAYQVYPEVVAEGKLKLRFSLEDLLVAILTHEMDEVITGDIPYSAKKLLRESGKGQAVEWISEEAIEEVKEAFPPRLLHSTVKPYFMLDGAVEKDVEVKSFVKYLDYVGLYLNCIRYENKGYNLGNTIKECIKLIKNHKYYGSSNLISQMVDNPRLFIDIDDN